MLPQWGQRHATTNLIMCRVRFSYLGSIVLATDANDALQVPAVAWKATTLMER
jgi:hypothetical protein